jgi:hypothetical protein
MSNKQTENRYTPAFKKSNPKEAAKQQSIRSKKLWTILAIALATVIAVTSSLCIALYKEKIPQNINSDATSQGSSNLTISNSNFKYTFADGQNLQYPLIPNDWTPKEDMDKSSIMMGVLDTSDWENVLSDLSAKNLTLALPNPYYPTYDGEFDEDESRVYLISKKRTAEDKAAYVTSNGFTINSGTYVKISVWVKTFGVEGTSLYFAIKDSANLSVGSTVYRTINMKTTPSESTDNNGWTEYSIYVEGHKTTNKTVYLEIGMGRDGRGNSESAYGTALFTGIDSQSISIGTYKTHIQTTQDENKNYLSYSFDDDTAQKTLSAWNYNKELNDETYSTITYGDYKAEAINQAGSEDIMPFDGDDAKMMYKLDTADNQYSMKFDRFAVNPPSIDKCYRLSVWIRTINITKSSGAYIYLNAYDRNGNYVADSSSVFSLIQTPTDLVNSAYNGWAEYQFYVQPSETDVYEMELEITIGLRGGAENYSEISGKAYINEINLYELDYTEFTSASKGTTVNTLSLKSTVSTKNLVNNGSFNNTKTSAPSLTYPIAPASWSSLYAGQRSIVENYDENKLAPNKSDAFYDDYSSIGGMIYRAQGSDVFGKYFVEPNDFYYADDDAHSALVIYNKEATAHGYTSTAITLTKNSFYRISVLAKGINSAIPSVYLTNGSTTVFAGYEGTNNGNYVSNTFIDIDENINGTGYNRYYIYVATGNTDKTVYLELWLGNRGATDNSGYQQGTVLFDSAECLLLDDIDQDTKVSEEYQSLFEGENPSATTAADIKNIYTEMQTVTSNKANLAVLDYRFNEVDEKGDLSRIIDYAKTKTEIDSELRERINTYNSKFYENETEGKYYIELDKNDDDIKSLRVYLNSLLNAKDETPKPGNENENKEPLNWIVLSSLIITSLMLIAIVVIIIRRFVRVRKTETVDSNYNVK